MKIKQHIKKNKYQIIALWFLLLQILVLFENLIVYRYNIFFWFCDHAPLILAIAFFTKNKDLIKSIVNFGFIVQFIWVIDFLSKLILDKSALGVTNYMFTGELGFLVLIPLLIHSLSVNVAFIHTYKIKPTTKVLVYSAIYIISIFALSLAFTPTERNVNCIHEICGLKQYTFQGYTSLWPILVFIIIILPTQGIQWLVYKWDKKRKKKKEHISKTKTAQIKKLL